MRYDDIQKVLVPLRTPDFEYAGHLYWFKEKLSARMRSDLKREVALLAECPVTHRLMYMDGYSPEGWYLIQDEPVQRMYRDLVFEEEVLV